MGTRTYTYTWPGSQPSNTVLLSVALPAFTGSYTITQTVDVAFNGILNFKYQFYKSSTSTVNREQTNSFNSGSLTAGTINGTVGSPAGSWTGTDFDTFRYLAGTTSATNQAGKTVTITLSGANVPDPNPCVYGTHPSSSAPAIAFVTDATIAAACTLIGAPWLAVLFAPLIGYALDTGVLCGSGPPAMPTITNSDLLSSVQSRVAA